MYIFTFTTPFVTGLSGFELRERRRCGEAKKGDTGEGGAGGRQRYTSAGIREGQTGSI